MNRKGKVRLCLFRFYFLLNEVYAVYAFSGFVADAVGIYVIESDELEIGRV